MREAQNSKFKNQNCASWRNNSKFKNQNSKLREALRATIQNSKFKIQKS